MKVPTACECSEARGMSERAMAAAAKAHDCQYVAWRNTKIPTASRRAHERAQREGANPLILGPGMALYAKYFQEEMVALCTPSRMAKAMAA